jgi:hypothetical protein
MPNSRLLLSFAAFLTGIALIWMLVSLHVIERLDLGHIAWVQFVYFVIVFVFYVYYWLYFYNRPRGSKTVIDGRLALSVSALIVGGTVGYALIDLRVLVPWRPAGVGPGHFPYFIACTLSPLALWFLLFLRTRQQKRAERRHRPWH